MVTTAAIAQVNKGESSGCLCRIGIPQAGFLKHMISEMDHPEERPPRWHRIILAVIMPMCLQIYMLYWIFIWAEEDSGAAAFYPLAATLLMIVALPTALVANTWMVGETMHWRIYWVILIGHLQATLIPIGIIVYFLL